MANLTNPKETNTQSNLKKLEDNPYKYKSLVYPEDLGLKDTTQGHYVLFNINSSSGIAFAAKKGGQAKVLDSEIDKPDTRAYKNKSYSLVTQGERGKNGQSGEFSFSNSRVHTSIALQMPTTPISATYGAQWEQSSLGLAGDTAKRFGDAVNAYKGANGDNKDVLGALGKAAGTGLDGSVDAILTTILPQELQDVLYRKKGQANNPRVEVMFRGVGNRTFQFDFKLTPMNDKEAQTIREIIYVLKYAQAPSFKGTHKQFFNYPDTFNISFYFVDSDGTVKVNDSIHKISNCAMTNLTIDYSGSGGYFTYKDGSPVAVTLSMSFTELELITRENIVKGY